MIWKLIATLVILLSIGIFILPSSASHSWIAYLLAAFLVVELLRSTVKIAEVVGAPNFVLLVGFIICVSLNGAFQNSDLRIIRDGILLIFYLFGILSVSHRWPELLRVLLWAIFLSAALASFGALVNHVYQSIEYPKSLPRLMGLGRLHNPVIAGMALGFAALSGTLLIVNSSRKLAIPLGILLLLVLIVLAETGSRGPIAAMVIAIGILLMLSSSKFRFLNIMAFGSIASLLLSSIILYSNRWENAFESGVGRARIWKSALQHLDNLAFGIGQATPTTIEVGRDIYNHPHSIYISNLVYNGLAGTAALLAIVWGSMVFAWKHRSQRNSFCLLILLVYSLIVGLVDGGGLVIKPNIEWLVFWLPIVAINSAALNQSPHTRHHTGALIVVFFLIFPIALLKSLASGSLRIQSSSIEEKSPENNQLEDGLQCAEGSECKSGYCFYAYDKQKFCVSKAKNCSAEGLRGYMYGEVIIRHGIRFQCYHPKQSPGSWRVFEPDNAAMLARGGGHCQEDSECASSYCRDDNYTNKKFCLDHDRNCPFEHSGGYVYGESLKLKNGVVMKCYRNIDGQGTWLITK